MVDIRNRTLITTGNSLGTEDNADDLEWYGFDPNVYPRAVEETVEIVVDDVLGNFIDLNDYLNDHIDPLRESNNLGVDIFSESLERCLNLVNMAR